MASTRQQKMSRLLKEELSRIIREEINDPRLGMISITDVAPSPDLRIAHIYISAYGTQEERNTSMQVLERAAGFLRGELGRQLDLRYTPEIYFHLDESIEKGARVFELLQKIKTTQPPGEESDEKEEDGDGQS